MWVHVHVHTLSLAHSRSLSHCKLLLIMKCVIQHKRYPNQTLIDILQITVEGNLPIKFSGTAALSGTALEIVGSRCR